MLFNLLNHRNRLKALQNALRTIALSAPKDLLQVSLNRILDFLGAERGSILLFDTANQELALKIARGQEETLNASGNFKQRIGEGISGTVAQEKKPILVKNINKDRRFKNNHNRLAHYKTDSFLSVPLFIKDTFIGVINITDRISKKPFSEEDMDYLLIIASYISLSFERIKFYEEARIQKTELKKVSFEKNDLDRQLDSIKKFASLGKISAGIAHEINNPLDGIIRYTNLCMEQAKEEDTIKEYLKEIKEGLNRIANIVRSLLEFSRQNSGEKNLMIDVNKAMDESLKSIRGNNHGISVIKNYEDNLPKISDKGIKQVFTNLIKNAYEAIEDKKGALKIQTTKGKKSIEIKINDTGCGIAQENISRVFEPFFTTKPIDKGAGLGLSICYDIIERYDGNIKIDSELGKGSTFTITIPSD